MITTQLKDAILGTLDIAYEEVSGEVSERFDILEEYLNSIEPDLSGLDETNPAHVEIAKERTREALGKLVDKANELGFTDSELITFFQDK
jgi:hypothetical protein